MDISITILAKNCGAYIRETLDSLVAFDDVIVLDNGSTDDTVEVAEGYPNVHVVAATFIGFGPLHNLATSHAKHDWVFSIDSDEVLSPALLQEIKELPLDKAKAYSVPRHNFYRGRHIRGCGWSPDRVVRLYNRHTFQFSQDQVHERVVVEAKDQVSLKAPLLHTPYRTIADFLRKMQLYSDLFAAQSTKNSSPLTAVGHGLAAFLKSYFLKRGILDGYPGFLISAYNGHTAFYKYLKLFEKHRFRV